MGQVSMGLVAPETRSTSALEFAIRAEDAGFSSLWMGELWGADAFVRLTEVACHTSVIDLGTAIVNVYSRTPAVLAMASCSLARISAGRFRLGVGTSTRTAIEDLHGMAFSRPVRRTRETVELVHNFTDSERDEVTYSGEIFSVDGFRPITPEVPIYNAALGPLNRRVTGALCDGWMPNCLPLSSLEDAFESVIEAADAVGRKPADVDVTPWIPVAVADDEALARRIIRDNIAYFVGSGSGYRAAVASSYPRTAEQIHEAWNEGRHQAARERVPDELIEDLGFFGTPETIQDRLEPVLTHPIIDEPIIYIPRNAPPDVVERTFAEVNPASLDGG